MGCTRVCQESGCGFPRSEEQECPAARAWPPAGGGSGQGRARRPAHRDLHFAGPRSPALSSPGLPFVPAQPWLPGCFLGACTGEGQGRVTVGDLCGIPGGASLLLPLTSWDAHLQLLRPKSLPSGRVEGKGPRGSFLRFPRHAAGPISLPLSALRGEAL